MLYWKRAHFNAFEFQLPTIFVVTSVTELFAVVITTEGKHVIMNVQDFQTFLFIYLFTYLFIFFWVGGGGYNTVVLSTQPRAMGSTPQVLRWRNYAHSTHTSQELLDLDDNLPIT